MALYQYPKSTVFNRIIPKQSLYKGIGTGAGRRDFLNQHIKRIRWANKLGENTLPNIIKTANVPEIAVIRIIMRTQKSPMDIIKAMDKTTIPTIYEIEHNTKIMTIMAYKTQNAKYSGRWTVQGDYIQTDWTNKTDARQPLPMVRTLEQLYYQILCKTMGIAPPPETITAETIITALQHRKQYEKTQRKITQLENKFKQEKQFNRQVEIRAEIIKLKHTSDM